MSLNPQYGDRGAAFTITVTQNFRKIVVGYSEKQRKHKLIGGRVEDNDALTNHGLPRDEMQTVIAGATRELFRETGIVGDKKYLSNEEGPIGDNDLLGQMEVLFPITQVIRHGQHKRYFCFAILKTENVLGRDTIEADEMRPAELWSVSKILHAGRTGGFNPFHALAICDWISLFHEMDVASQVPHCKAFAQLTRELREESIDWEQIAAEIRSRLASRDI